MSIHNSPQGQSPPPSPNQNLASNNELTTGAAEDHMLTCYTCSTNLNYSEMICCSRCHNQFHKSCTKLCATVLNADWQCEPCQQNQTIQNTNSSSAKGSARAPSTSSKGSQSRRVTLELRRAEEERQLALAEIAINKEFIKRKYQILSEEGEDGENKSSHSTSVRAWVDSQEEFRNSNSTIIPQRLAITNEEIQGADVINQSSTIHRIDKNTTSNHTAGENVRFSLPIHQPHQLSAIAATTANYIKVTSNNIPHINPTTEPSRIARTSDNFQGNSNNNSCMYSNSTFHNVPTTLIYSTSSMQPHVQGSYTQSQNTPAMPINNNSSFSPFSTTIDASCISCTNLTKEQIQARHSVPKELPIFSGHPEEWPVFSSTFDWSTIICGLTDAENLLRIQKSLRGEALRSVQHLLVHPSCVPAVISTLKLLFGQPEKILQSIKTRIKSTPPISANKLDSFTTFAVNVKSLIATIEACGLHDELNNSSLLQELIEKMPPQYQLYWGTHKLDLLKINQRPNLLEFSNWIFSYGLSASSVTVTTSHASSSDNHTRNKMRDAFVHAHSAEKEKKCVVCKLSCKSVPHCNYFLNADRSERWNIVRKNNLCRQCLYPHASKCQSQKRCGVDGCAYSHHALLHRFFPERDNRDLEQDKVNVNTHSQTETKFKTLFKILPISVFGKNKIKKTFAFIDEGSSVSLCDEELIRELELKGTAHPLCLKWTGQVQRTENTSQRIVVTIAGENGKHAPIEVHTVSKLSLPIQTLDYEAISKRFQHLKNLPICSFKDATPRILIGANNWSLGIPKEIRENKPSEPVAVRTQLGWLIYGGGKCYDELFNFHICECGRENDSILHELVKTAFSIENLGVAVSNTRASYEEERGITLLNKYTKKRADKHFETGLLWRFDEFQLPESYDMAKKRLQCLERKLKLHPELGELFKRTLEEYLQKGYIRKLSNEIDQIEKTKSKRVWYLPIFAVFNKNKPGKGRVVWDAAAKSQGVSLNSLLIKGPDLMTSLPRILFRFREKLIAVCGDIEQMFHQIFIRREDQDAQRFLWRDCDENKSADVYVMNVMIFGASCAPSTSQFIKNLNASDFDDEFPAAVKAIKEDHYVDDFLTSVDTVQEAIKLVSEVKFIHKQGGFNIRKWSSNNNEVLQSIEEDQRVEEKNLALSEEPAVEKVLGVYWIPSDDMITFKISQAILQNEIFLGTRPPTKREMLRILMSTYDPLGLIGNFLMYLKILLQEVWRSAVDWDEPVLEAQIIKWKHWIKFLPSLQNIRIQRCHLHPFSSYDGLDIQIHTFVDASQNGYAAVCFLRLSDGQETSCSLIGSKTRVAPLKMVSVPRLELMAAVIGVRFAKHVIESHSIKIGRHFYWSDSKTVLCWLRAADHRRYHQFVAFRISEILEATELKEWRWVPSKLNVADEATKWAKNPDIIQSSQWFSGPPFLRQPEATWPKEEHNTTPVTAEMRNGIFHISLVNPLFDVQRFSRWNRLLRAAAYIFRYVGNLRRRAKQLPTTRGEINQEELQKAEALIYRQAQHQEYADFIHDLKAGKGLKKSSSIYKLTPLIDENDVLRADGRIDNALVPEEQKKPIILPRNNYITDLILNHYHNLYHHLNNETVTNEIRQKYYIARLRVTLRKAVRNCQQCKIKKAMPKIPQMAKLPHARLASFVAPFTYTGIDFFGPIIVTVGRHTEKRYGALFTCLTIRAVHVEIVYTLTTSSCILAIRNFMARRGTPREFFSDNGTNFVGAERELREALKEIDTNAFIRSFTTTVTKWKFNTPAAPHMGGAWERLVRSIKTVFYKIAPAHPPNEELLRSMMAEIENIVNARPLAYVPLENDTAEALTPNHFLLGSSNGIKPMAIYDDETVVLKNSWRISQQYADAFWRKWIAEYLPSLTCRTKWHEKANPLQVGDLVLVVDPRCPRNVWPRGRVLGVKVSTDGQVRSAQIQTAHGILERPAAKLAILEVAARREYSSENISCNTGG